MSQRNAPCPCGSGRKHKVCCGVTRQRQTRWLATTSVALFVFVAAWVVWGVLRQASGEHQLPEGWVWSEEHGHPHRVGGAQAGFVEPPPDAVWDPEHGHFHDSEGRPIGAATPTPSSPPTSGD